MELTNTSYHTRHPLCTNRHLFSRCSSRIRILSFSYIIDDSLVEWTHVDKLDCDQRTVRQRRENFVTPVRDRCKFIGLPLWWNKCDKQLPQGVSFRVWIDRHTQLQKHLITHSWLDYNQHATITGDLAAWNTPERLGMLCTLYYTDIPSLCDLSRCRLRSLQDVKTYEQCPHEYGFAPVWIRTWSFSWPFVLNILPQ